jgi:hypothetical protein
VALRGGGEIAENKFFRRAAAIAGFDLPKVLSVRAMDPRAFADLCPYGPPRRGSHASHTDPTKEHNYDP